MPIRNLVAPEDDLRQQVSEQREASKRDLARIDEREREHLRALHWMRCPKCGAELREIAFRGVRVDKCFSCGGVYLDDGELEELAGKPGWFEGMRYLFSER